jgi:hypothetical protein
MILDALLALGLLLSTASELRPMGAPLGPGEALLVIWALAMLFREADRLGAPLTPALCRLLIFWLLFAIALSFGTLAGYVLDDLHDPDLFFHDVMAYPLLAAVSCLSVTGPSPGLRLHRVAWLLVAFGSLALAVQIAIAWGLVQSAAIDPWYWDRFRGWSANPIQLALLCTVLALLSLHLADAADRTVEKIAALACAVLPIYVGRLTKSDSFSLVMVTAIPIFAALKLRDLPLSFGPKLTFRQALAWVAVLALPLLLISTLPLGSLIAVQAEDVARGISKDGGKTSQQEAELRFQSWREGIDRGVESGMLGLGPGPHLHIPVSLVTARKREILPKYVDTPAMNGTPNFEAHNTPIDLLTQGGVIAVFSLVWISAAALFNSYKARLAGLATLLCGVSIFGLGNLIIRHPLFWFTIALCLVSWTGARMAPARFSS